MIRAILSIEEGSPRRSPEGQLRHSSRAPTASGLPPISRQFNLSGLRIWATTRHRAHRSGGFIRQPPNFLELPRYSDHLAILCGIAASLR